MSTLSEVISPLKRIAVFYDGSFFTKISNFYKFNHIRKSFLNFDGLHEFIKQKVAEKEANGNTSLCQIVEAHFFRGRFSLKSVQLRPDPLKQLESDRYYDQLLMQSDIITHFFPMNENINPPEEKGIDVWLALEAYDLAVHKKYDVLVLFAGDQDFIPLIKKINSIGTRVLVISVNIEGNGIYKSIYSSQKLINEASYTIILNEEIDSKKSKGDNSIENLFVK